MIPEAGTWECRSGTSLAFKEMRAGLFIGLYDLVAQALCWERTGGSRYDLARVLPPQPCPELVAFPNLVIVPR